MPDNVDEDLIEATIRRVAEAKAAREDASEPDEATKTTDTQERRPSLLAFAADRHESPSPPGGPDEDTIEATIRRVAEAKAAAEAGEQDERDESQPLEAVAVPPSPEQDADRVAADGPDEDMIAATIARVQAQKAAADSAQSTQDITDIPTSEGDEDPIEATIRRVQAQKPARELHYDDEDITQDSSGGSHGGRGGALTAWPHQRGDAPRGIEATDSDDEADVVARLARSLHTAEAAIEALTARVEVLERAALHAPPPQVSPLRAQPSRDTDAVAGALQRPAIFRDAALSPRTALAEQLPEPDVIDTRPLPKPLPPLQVEPKRGLDLLPRTYRITVEDKRRGVDLVPLHRALLSMDGVRDMSLLSYNNGVAIVSLEMNGDLESDELGNFVARAMSRGARVEQHNEHTFVVKLAED